MASKRRSMIKFSIAGLRQHVTGQVLSKDDEGVLVVKVASATKNGFDYTEVHPARVIEEWEEISK